MMEGWGLMGGFGFIFWLLILAAIVAGLVWFFRSEPLAGGRPKDRSPGLEVLEQRYARGEITREEYLQKKHDITD
jgi:putative membrane protein